MQKSGIVLVSSGVLIVVGLVLLVVGNQVILEGVSQGNGMVNTDQDLTISGEFASEKSAYGVFVIQVMEFRENTFSARVLDPSGIEIASEMIQSETTEKEFEIGQTGNYRLTVQSNSDKESHVFGAIGPLPDAGKKSLGFLSSYLLIAGMIGLAVSGIYGIKKRKKSI